MRLRPVLFGLRSIRQRAVAHLTRQCKIIFFVCVCLVQCWIQSFRNTGHVTDGAGQRAFALVNRATGKAPGHRRGDELVRPSLPRSICETLGADVFARQVNLAGHRPDSVDVALLWTQSDDLRQGFHNIRTVSDADTILDAANGVPEAGGAHDGTPIIVFPWNGGSNQNWKMLPFY